MRQINGMDVDELRGVVAAAAVGPGKADRDPVVRARWLGGDRAELTMASGGAPVYIEEPTACFRWYETSKSGGGYEVQMRETAELSERYGGSPWTVARARVKMAAVVNIYKLMALARQALRSSRNSFEQRK